ARVAALRLGMGEAMRAFTVQINCGSGMQSIDTGFRLIEGGKADLILAGGAEALSHSPLVLSNKAAAWFGRFAIAKTPWERAAAIGGFRPEMAKPVIGLERGLTDPLTDLGMGQTAEIIGHAFGVTREAADAYALESHQR